jgi:hypothetical protein
MTGQLPSFKGGLGLTPQSAFGIAAEGRDAGTSTFIGWLAPAPAPSLDGLRNVHTRTTGSVVEQGQCLEDHSTWTAGPLDDLKHGHLLQLRRGGARCQRGRCRRRQHRGTCCRSSFSSATQHARKATSPFGRGNSSWLFAAQRQM